MAISFDGNVAVAPQKNLTSERPLTEEQQNRIRKMKEDSRADNTKRAYRFDWIHFVSWCESEGRNPVPCSESTIMLYILYMMDEGMKVNTMERHLSSIATAHRASEFPSPMESTEARVFWQGVRKNVGLNETRKKAITIDILRNMIKATTDDLRGARDRALLLIGFAGAFRRSELVGIRMEDIEFVDAGVIVTLPKSKTDQEGQGKRKGIPYRDDPSMCPVRALQKWIEESGIETGPIFLKIQRGNHVVRNPDPERGVKPLSGYWVSRIIKSLIEQIGLDSDGFGGHSLRAGLATTAYQSGASELSIMQQTGHKSIMTFRKYIRDENVFHDNAVSKIDF